MVTEIPFGYYCPSCADQLELRASMNTDNVLVKHARSPSSSNPVQPASDSSSTEHYQKAIEETVKLGGVVQGYRGLSAVMQPSTGRIGETFYYGITGGDADTVVVVKSTDDGKTHAFPKQASEYAETRCTVCGGPFLPGG